MADAGKVDEGEHALLSSWNYYELRERQGKESYLSQHFELCKFTSIEDFWRNWHFIPKPSMVFSDGNSRAVIERGERKSAVEGFVLFRSDLTPDTDTLNPERGTKQTVAQLRWRVTRSRPGEHDKAWEVLVMAIIGEAFDGAKFVNGARLVDKTTDKKGTRAMVRYEIWLSRDEPRIVDSIADALTKVLKSNTSLGDIVLKVE